MLPFEPRRWRLPGVAFFAAILPALLVGWPLAASSPLCEMPENRPPLPNVLDPLLARVDLVASGWVAEGFEQADGSWDALLTVAQGIHGVEDGRELRLLFDQRPNLYLPEDKAPWIFLLEEATGLAGVRIVQTGSLGHQWLWDATDLVCGGEDHPALVPLIRYLVHRHGAPARTPVVLLCRGESEQRYLRLDGGEVEVQGPPLRFTELAVKARLFVAPVILDAGEVAEPVVLGAAARNGGRRTFFGLDTRALGFLAAAPVPRAALGFAPDEMVALVIPFERPVPPWAGDCPDEVSPEHRGRPPSALSPQRPPRRPVEPQSCISGPSSASHRTRSVAPSSRAKNSVVLAGWNV